METEGYVKLLISRYVSGSLSDAEAVFLAEWVRRSPQNAADFRREVQSLAAKGSTTSDAVTFWRRFSERSRRMGSAGRSWWSRGRKYIGAAAATVAVFCLSMVVSYVTVDHRTEALINPVGVMVAEEPSATVSGESTVYTAAFGERRSVVLPDSTRVTLNSGARLTLAVDFNVTERRVDLDGEAYFEVAKNPAKRFTVCCGDDEYVVRGTSFNIVSYADDRLSIVTLHTGRLEARISEDVIMLKPGDELRVDERLNQITRQSVDVSNSISWMNDGQLRFSELPLKYVASQLAHKYDVKINVHSSIENIMYDGQIDDESLADALRLVAMTSPVPLVVTEFDGEFYVSRRSMRDRQVNY